MKKTVLIAFVFILASCSAGASEVSRNQIKWQEANIAHYRFDLTVGCFCPFRSRMPMTVEVKNGEIISITDVNRDTVSTTDPTSEFILKYATIDRLFSELESDSVRKADKVAVSYDPIYGFPDSISIDFIKLAVEDELAITVSAFEPLP
jgi:hypothetical protein